MYGNHDEFDYLQYVGTHPAVIARKQQKRLDSKSESEKEKSKECLAERIVIAWERRQANTRARNADMA